ncbi:MAG: hypothetical protein ACOX87_03030 [Chloroflexota bacterium]|jgi:hypothetical protein
MKDQKTTSVMKRLGMTLMAVVAATAVLSSVAFAQGKPEFKLGFKLLADQIPDVVGEPLENEHWGANGDSLQQTSKGLMVWRKADNWTAFTNGSRTWINGPFGVQERSNDERFPWEAQDGVTDCGTDLGCFIQASESGSQAKVDYTVSINFFGMLSSTTSLLEIHGREGDRLLFSSKIVRIEVDLSDDIKNEARATGKSDAEIQQEIEKMNADAQAAVGTGTQCRFPQPNLTATLKRWQNGEFSTEDFNPEYCTNIQP